MADADRSGRAFTDLVGCELPLQLAGMGGAPTAELAIAVSVAGGLGMLSGVGGADVLAGQLDAVPAGVVVGVNFLGPFLDPAALDVAARRSRLVELFWAEPDAAVVERIHDGGALAGWQVGSVDEARRATAAGCDVVIVQGVEAGGHVRGTVPRQQLVAEVRASSDVDVVLVAAGGIGTAEDVTSALAAGADAVRVGTRLLAAVESGAHPDYVGRLVAASAEDTVLTTAFGEGWPDAPHRVLRSAVDAGRAAGAGHRWTPNWPAAGHPGPIDGMALYAGTSVGAVTGRRPAAEIIGELLDLPGAR